ncbi:MAG: cysteine desulfurase family protein [Chlamydiota bacterium]
MITKKIYLDNNATTALDPRVLRAMLLELEGAPSNPSSIHTYGQRAKQLLYKARKNISTFFNVNPDELIFTSGGTESVNTAIHGLMHSHSTGHIISTSIDHSCVFQTLTLLQKQGYDLTFLEVGLKGAPELSQIENAIRPDTKLIALSIANSETGVMIDLEPIAALCLERKIPLVLDGVAILGKEIFSIPKGVSAMCFSAHKIHGPKGTGLLFLRSNAKFSPLILGGPQENNRRAGTENLAGILGFEEAVAILKETQESYIPKIRKLRDYFEKTLQGIFPHIIINGEGPRVCNISNLSFLHVNGENLLIQLDRNGIMASHGSACSSGSIEPSRILLNMGIPRKQAKGAVRFSFSRLTSQEEVDTCIEVLRTLIPKLTME